MLDIAQYSGVIAESAEVGNQVIRVIATDADSGSFGEITYTILMGNEVANSHWNERTINTAACIFST